MPSAKIASSKSSDEDVVAVTMVGKGMLDDLVEVSVIVANVGDDDEVVQLYLTDLKASVARPNKQLSAFRRVHIRSGESESVKFTLRASDFALYDKNMRYVVEPGDFRIAIGTSSSDIRAERIVTVL